MVEALWRQFSARLFVSSFVSSVTVGNAACLLEHRNRILNNQT